MMEPLEMGRTPSVRSSVVHHCHWPSHGDACVVCVFVCVCMCLSPRTLSSIEDSDVYQMLQRDQEETHAPRQSGSFKALQDFIDSDGEQTQNKCLPPG